MKKIYAFFVILGFTLSVSLSSFAQISKGGKPSSFKHQNITSVFDIKSIPAIDVNAAMVEDANRPGPYWAGRSIATKLNMTNAGTWTDLPDGNRIWRLKLISTGAKGLAVVYDNFYIPEGGKLFLYNEAKTQVIGAYTSDNNPSNGVFSTELIQGESVTLEYVAPIQRKFKPLNQINGTIQGDKIVTENENLLNEKKPVISISEIVYLYHSTPILDKYDPAKTTGFGSSLACEVNVNCSEGTNWQNEKRGVAEIWLRSGGSWGWCTGSLVNTTNNSGTPYFLTADHCHSEGGVTATAADMLVWQFYFKYESPNCANPAADPYTASFTLTGCTLTAASPINGGSDFCLVLLGTTPPQSYNPYYNGWDRTNTAPTSGVGIHHPAGDIKKISTFTSTLSTGSWNDGTNIGAANAHWSGQYIATTNGWGQTEGGSSGSPIFNSSKRISGTLTGGTAASCTAGSSFDYGKIFYHWDLGGAASTQRLKPWLDPVSNNATSVNGYDPFAGYPDFYGVPTTLYAGATVNYTDITNGATTWLWNFEGGNPSTSTLQNPTNITYAQQGTYRVSLTTSTPTAGTQVQEKIGYITVLPGVAPTQVWCDDFTTASNWTITNHVTGTQLWKIGSTAPTGTYSGPMGVIGSTSGGNYALFDSDGLTTANTEQWSSISSNTAVNCAGYEAVILKFQENYQKFYDSTLVYVSTDNFVTSTRYVLHEGYAQNDASGNPYNYSLDISSAAAGLTNVKVRFTFRSTPSTMGANAGWGYAWEIDDVCIDGILPGNSLPKPDFMASTSKEVSPSQSVSFQDQSQFATSWLWTFDGGTPSTSTLQNPTGIVYNTQGYYAVTLAATNANGTITKTKTDYIHVYYDCSFDSNIQDGDALSYSGAPGAITGYIPGHNSEMITAYADKVTIGNLTGKVKSLAVAVAHADVVGGTTNVTFTVWNDNAGAPGTVLASKVVPVKDLQSGFVNYFNFSPVSVGSTFWVGFQLSYVANLDTFACYLASGGVGRTNTAYVYNGTNWVTYESKYGTSGSLYIKPEFCLDKPGTNVPDADFYADKTEIAPGNAVNYTDQSTGGPVPTSWLWTLTGGSSTSSTVQNPSSITYTTAGLYDVTLNATNANGSDAENKVAYIHVSPTTNLVYWNFPNNPDNATADGGIPANTSAVITNWGANGTPNAMTFATAGATTRSASVAKWDAANTANSGAWSVTFSTAGYTNIKLSSKQAASSTSSPRDFQVYYNVNGAGFNFLADVHSMTTANDWTQGVLNNVQLPAACDNQASVEIAWYKSSDVSANGGAVTATATSLIDDIMITGEACSTLPSAAGTITGTSTVCQGQQGVTYSVPAITGATAYMWTVPTGVTIVSGEFTRTITVNFAQNQTTGNFTVFGRNICGDGTVSANYAISINPVPIAPSTITGSQTVVNGQTAVAYSVSAVATATSYTWTTPSFATIATGATSRSITADFACPGNNGNISVHANNTCGAGPESYTLAISIICSTPVSDFVADNTNVVAGSTVNFSDLSQNTPTSWSWSFAGGTPSTSTVKNPAVVYSTPGVYDVTLTSTNALGGNTITKTGYIIVTTAPIALVNWDFPNNPDNATADGGIAANLTKTISVVGGVTGPTYATAGATTRCANGLDWTLGNGTKYWQVDFVTTGYQSITVSSKMTGNNNRSPRDFKLQYKVGAAGTWTDVTGATMTLSLNTWSNAAANLSNVALPVACDNQDSVYLRWIMTSNTAISGTIQNTRSCYIDDIIVMGVPATTPPVANFSGTPTTVCAGQTVSYTDASTNSPSSWSWTFAGGTPATATTQNPTVTYNTAGTYTVDLTATNGSGSNTNTKNNYITVNPLPAAAGTINGTATVCQGQTGVTYTVGAITDATGYTWTLPTGATITAGNNTNSITVSYSNSASSGNLTVKGTNTCGSGTVSANYAVTVNPLPVAAGTITGSATVCQGQTGVTYSVAAITNATSYTWSLPTGVTIVSGNGTDSITVDVSASAVTGNITVYGTNTCGSGTTSANYALTINPSPTAAGTITGSATVCQGQTGVTYSVPAITNATSYTWTFPTGATITSGSGTRNITVSYSASAISGNISVAGTNTCGNGTSSTNLAVTVNSLPTAAGTITGTNTVCQGQMGISYSISAISGSTGYNWTLPTGAIIASGNNTNSIIIDFNGTAVSGNITVAGTNTCGSGTVSANYALTVNSLPATAGTITGNTTICQGQTAVAYSVPAISGATNYVWTLPSGVNTVSGTGTDSITVDISGVATSGNISVYGTNSCGNGITSANHAVTVSQLPTVAGTISGSATVCQGQTAVIYSVPSIANATSYNWTLPTGATITAGSGTNSITVSYAANAVSGNITVFGSNSCGDGTVSANYTITVNLLAGAAGTINGTASVCQGQTGVSYTVAAISGASSYNWSLPLGTTITSGSGTNVIVVDYSDTAASGNISVNGGNTCGNGATSALFAITVNSAPAPAGTITGSSQVCLGQSSVTYSIPTINGVTNYNWTVPTGATIVAGANTSAITIDFNNSAVTGDITVYGSNNCGNGSLSSTTVTVNSQPIANAGIDASITSSSTTTLNGSATGGSGNYSYSWTPSNLLVDASIANPTTLSIPTSQLFTLVVTDNNTGCQNTDYMTVVVSGGALSINAIGTPTVICAGNSTQLSAVAGGGTGNYTYSWSSTPAGLSNTTSNPTVTPTTTTTYTVEVNDGSTTATSSVVITVTPLPLVTPGVDQSICNGTSANLSATGTGTFAWSNGATNATTIVSPIITTTYTVTLSNNGCEASNQVVVTVMPNPIANAGLPQTICFGQSATLIATGGTQYSWASGQLTDTITVSPTLTTTYTVVVTDASGCSASDNILVTVNPLPLGSAGADQTICGGSSTTLIATGGTSYEWSTLESTATITINPTNNTTYMVTVTDNGCSATDQVIVNVNPIPTVNAGSNQSICIGGSATLAATGNGTFNWSNGASGASIVVFPTVNTTYTVTITNNTCTASNSVVVNVNPALTADAGLSQTICNGQSTTLTATGGTNYLWTNGGNTDSTTVSPTTTTIYSVTVSSGSCSATDNVTITVNPLPNANAGVDQTICLGTSSTLVASGGTSYSWSSGEALASIVVSPIITSTYVATVTDNGCSNTDNVIINVKTLPIANAGTDQSIFNGSSTTLNGSATGGSGLYSYSWTPANYLLNAGLANPTTTALSNTTVFTLVVSDSIGCFGTDQVNITVTGGVLSVVADVLPATICAGENINLNAITSGGSGSYSYTWTSVPAGYNGTSASAVVNPSENTTYIVSVNDGANTSTSSTAITVNPATTANIVAASMTMFCDGGSVTLNANTGNGLTYQWQLNGSNIVGAFAASYDVTISGTYNVIVSNTSGCSALSNAITTTVFPLPTANAGVDIVIPSGTSTTLSAQSGGSGSYSYSWTPVNNLLNANVQTPVTTNLTATTLFTLTVQDAYGCSNTDQVNVIVSGGTLTAVANSNPTTICSGNSAQLSSFVGGGSGVYTYSWTSTPTGFSSSLSTNSVSPLITTTYTLTLDDGSTTATSSVVVSVNQTPSAPVNPAGSTTFCQGGSVVLFTNFATGVSYQWQLNGSAISGATGVSYTASATGSYSVIASSGSCTASSSPLLVTVNPIPVANAGNDKEVCFGGSTTLTATGGTSYSWNTGGMSSTIAVSPLSTTTYIVTVNTDGCEATDAVTVLVRAIPIANAGADQTMCSGSSVTLIATGGTAYDWNNGTNNSNLIVSPVSTTTFTVTVSDFGCTAVDNVVVTVQPSPIANAGPDVSIQNGATTTLNGSANGGSGNYIYSWEPASQLANATILSPTTIALNTTTTFTFNVSDVSSGCQNSDQVVVTVTGLPLQLSTSMSASICKGMTAQLNAIATGGSGNYSYMWTSVPAGPIYYLANPTVTPSITTTYTVTANDGLLNATSSVVITVIPLPNAYLGADTTICSAATLLLDAGSGNAAYNWSTGATIQYITVDSTNIGIGTGIFTVTVTNANGCNNTDAISVTFDPCSGIQTIPTLSINCYPNPTSGEFNIELTGLITNEVQMTLININNQIILTRKQTISHGELSEQLDLSKLPVGVYYLKLTAGEKIIMKKVVIE